MKRVFVTFLYFTAINWVAAAENILWKQFINCDANSICTPSTMSIDSFENKAIILGTSEQRNTKNTYFQLWKIDSNGLNIQTKSLGMASEASKFMTKSLNMKVAVNPNNGDIVGLNVFSDTNGVSLSITDRKMESKKATITVDSEPKWSKGLRMYDILSCLNDKLIFVGKDSNSDGIIIKTDSTGNVIWKKTLDLGQNEILCSGTFGKDGNNFYAVGLSVSIKGKMEFSSAATICLLCYDENGELKASTYIEGGIAPWPTSFPKIICLSSGNLLVVYDKTKDPKGTDLYARIYTPEFEVINEKQILKTNINDPPAKFDICAIPGNRFAFAGIINFEDLRIYEYDAEGTVIQTLALDREIATGGVYIDYLAGKIITAFANKPEESENNIKIEVIALKSDIIQ